MYVAACAAVALIGIIQIVLVIQMARHLHAEGISVLPATLPLMQLASAVLTLLLLQPLSTSARDITAAIAAVLLAVATALDPLLLRRIVSAQNAETELAREKLLGEQLDIQRQHLASVTATLEQARSIRAGMLHKVGSIDGLLARGEDGQALLQLEQMVGSLGPARVRLCGNPVADALLAMKMERCDELGIAHSVNAVVPADLPLSGTETCALFANIVDNAIHACEVVPEGRRTLSLDAHAAGGFYVVRVKNSCASPDELRALERESAALRPDSGQISAESARPGHHQRTGNARGQGLSEHGWGLVILEQLAQRHGGRLETHRDERGSQDGPTFTTTVLLDLSR